MALVLTRGDGEKILIGNNIIITVRRHGNKTRVEIDAPKEVKIVRAELEEEGREAA